jgi:hypothetical protein
MIRRLSFGLAALAALVCGRRGADADLSAIVRPRRRRAGILDSATLAALTQVSSISRRNPPISSWW